MRDAPLTQALHPPLLSPSANDHPESRLMTIRTTIKAGNKTLFKDNFECIPEVGISFASHGKQYIVAEVNNVDENTATIQVRTASAQGIRGQNSYKPTSGRKK